VEEVALAYQPAAWVAEIAGTHMIPMAVWQAAQRFRACISAVAPGAAIPAGSVDVALLLPGAGSTELPRETGGRIRAGPALHPDS